VGIDLHTVAIGRGGVEAQPVIDLVAGADIKEGRVLCRMLGELEAVTYIRRARQIGDVERVAETDADIAAQIPSAGTTRLRDDGLIDRLRLRHIGRECRCAEHRRSGGADKKFDAKHGFVLSSTRTRARRRTVVETGRSKSGNV
jgi:hypothetical protein